MKGNSKLAYDLIGDIHGHAEKLEALLKKMGYIHTAQGWWLCCTPGSQDVTIRAIGMRLWPRCRSMASR
jgi:hypothetical protein